MENNPETPKSVAYATAVQQGHKVNKTPKDFRTSSGVREAKMKYDAPKSEYQKTANGEADEGTSGKGIPRGQILSFFKKNPNPKDEQVHELAESRGADPHKVEGQIYGLLTEKLHKTSAINSTMLTAMFDELENIEKDAIGLKALGVTTGLLAAGVGGAGQVGKAIASRIPTQITHAAQASVKKPALAGIYDAIRGSGYKQQMGQIAREAR
jgi:hypothetical protein